MDCQKADGLLMEWLYKELSPEQTEAVQMHLDVCARCEAVYAEFSETTALAAKLPELEPAAQISYDILREARKAASTSSHRPTLFSLDRFFLRPAFGSALLLCLVSATLFLFREAGIDRPTVDSADSKAAHTRSENLASPTEEEPPPVATPPELPKATDAPPLAQRGAPAAAPEMKARTSSSLGRKRKERGRSAGKMPKKKQGGGGGGGLARVEKGGTPPPTPPPSSAAKTKQRQFSPAPTKKALLPAATGDLDSSTQGIARRTARTSRQKKRAYAAPLMSQDARPMPPKQAGSATPMGDGISSERGMLRAPAPRPKAGARPATSRSMAVEGDAAPEVESEIEALESEDEPVYAARSQELSARDGAPPERDTPRQRLATATTLLKQGKAQQAARSLQALLKTLPSRDVLASETRHQLGRAQLAQRRTPQAIQALRSAANDPRYGGREAAKRDLLRGLQLAAAEAERGGRSRDALAYWKEIAQLDPRQRAKATQAAKRLTAPAEASPAAAPDAPTQ